jgi:thiol-disulfide isomerase/thioredoxin
MAMAYSKKYVQLILFLIISLGITSCGNEKERGIPQMDFGEFESYLKKENDTVYVVNFWATWCKPCLNELPDLEKVNAEYSDRKVEVILVSLDFPNQHDDLLVPFVEENNLKSRVLHLTDVDANKWIGKVSEDWSGAIPATLIYKGSDRTFHESVMTYEQLKTIVESKL